MQTCYNCHARQLDGTIFCSECGASLLAPRRDEGKAGSGREITQYPAVAAALPAEEPVTNADSQGRACSLIVLSSGRRITVRVDDEVLIGRRDDTRGIVPDIDLGVDGGYDAGVSRRHAILSYKDGHYLIEDLGSANGTFLNERRLVPQAPALLANGDEIKCGKLPMRIEIDVHRG